MLSSADTNAQTNQLPSIPAEIIADWEDADSISQRGYRTVIKEIFPELPSEQATAINTRLSQLASRADNDPELRDLYREACHYRRLARFAPYMDKMNQIVFTKHVDLGDMYYPIAMHVSGVIMHGFKAGSALCLLTMSNGYGRVDTLLVSPDGIIRDPDISFDGEKILFAWKKTADSHDYNLFEMTVADRSVRQLTHGVGYADYEPAYLPNGDIVFVSTRSGNIIPCHWTPATNLFICNRDGEYIRRVGFDHATVDFPTLMEDGTIVYTRRDYNDRTQVYTHPLFVMNPDGTGQIGFFGNNTYWPPAIIHARQIPGTGKLVIVANGYHVKQGGKLAVIDPSVAREGYDGIKMIAPIRQTSKEIAHQDNAPSNRCEHGHFINPYPLDERHFIVGWRRPCQKFSDLPPDLFYNLYFVRDDAARELLAWDSDISCSQPIPLAPKTKPMVHPNKVDYSKDHGEFFVQDVYHGLGVPGITRGTIKKLRIVEMELRYSGCTRPSDNVRTVDLEYRVGTNHCPIARDQGSWDAKTVLGEATVYEDGSAMFYAPARKPVYFQALDESGNMVQNMRSWATLMPGELQSCVGCHEDKNESVPPGGLAIALRNGPQELEKPYSIEGTPFSFRKNVQPILDRHCISCHDNNHSRGIDLQGTLLRPDELPEDMRKRNIKAGKYFLQSYITLTHNKGEFVDWISHESVPTLLPPYSYGSGKSKLIEILQNGHNDHTLSKQQIDILRCWIDLTIPQYGYYDEMLLTNPIDYEPRPQIIYWDEIERGTHKILTYIQNNKPYPAISCRATGSLSFVFDASASRGINAQNPIVDYHWDFGDGATSQGQKVNHTFSNEEFHTVTLTVRDNNNSSSRAAVKIHAIREPREGITYKIIPKGYVIANASTDFSNAQSTGIASRLNLSVTEMTRNYTISFEGAIRVPGNGNYTFHTTSDDGTMLYINDTLKVDNSGEHAPVERSGVVNLEAGYHHFRLIYSQLGGGQALSVHWQGPQISKEVIPDSVFFHWPPAEDVPPSSETLVQRMPSSTQNIFSVNRINSGVMLIVRSSQTHTVTLYNLKGRTVRRFAGKGVSTYTISRGEFSAGVYLIKFKSQASGLIEKVRMF
jgi:hypothetical protein